jgi:DNA-binding SARP family transcriptional activator
VLADLLWSEMPAVQTRKYLRQALWKLHTVLDAAADCPADQILTIEPAWLSINNDADLSLDVATFEAAFRKVEGVAGWDLSGSDVRSLLEAIDLYRGDLLEDWYQDWCIFERERLQNLYLTMLTKLTAYYESCGQYEAGIIHAVRLLGYDRAHERAHRSLMRMYYCAGDRTAALRQYYRCVETLREELGVEPAESTKVLYHAMIRDQDVDLRDDTVRIVRYPAAESGFSQSVAQLQANLHTFERQLERLQHDIESVQRRGNG